MKRFALSYTNRGESHGTGTGCVDRTFDSEEELHSWILSNNYGDCYDYHVWELVGGLIINTKVDVLKTPPNLT